MIKLYLFLISGTVCGADFFSSADKGADSPSECSEADLADRDRGGGGGERRRSERVKREKPDYYDALDFENKRKTVATTPTRAGSGSGGSGGSSGGGAERGSGGSDGSGGRLLSRRERLGRSPKDKTDDLAEGGGRVVGRRGRPSGRGSSGAPSASGRATLTWKKGGFSNCNSVVTGVPFMFK